MSIKQRFPTQWSSKVPPLKPGLNSGEVNGNMLMKQCGIHSPQSTQNDAGHGALKEVVGLIGLNLGFRLHQGLQAWKSFRLKR